MQNQGMPLTLTSPFIHNLFALLQYDTQETHVVATEVLPRA